jgi:Anti-sigma-K factor rskA, C-terminal
MARLDTLPADQRAVVGLLLRQGKGYDELSGLLHLDPETVRERAHAALAALAPAQANGLDAERRAELADFLLGQGSEADREAARVFLAGSASGRAWARGVAAELAPVGGERLPEVPDGPEPAAAAGSTPADPQEPPVSRRGGAILLGILAVVAVVIVVGGIVFGHARGGGESTGGRVPRTTTSPTTSTPAAGASAANTKVRAQANVTAPPGAPAPKALGVIQVVDVNGQRQLIAIVQGLPKPGRGEGFGIWLTAPNGRHTWLGFFQSADKQGRLVAQGSLRKPISGFDQMLVTRETGSAPTSPGRVYLQGRIQRAQGG